jgi:hypothetical protein
MYTFLADDVTLSSDRRWLDALPTQSRAKLLSVVAAFVPYYNHSAVHCVSCTSQEYAGISASMRDMSLGQC